MARDPGLQHASAQQTDLNGPYPPVSDIAATRTEAWKSPQNTNTVRAFTAIPRSWSWGQPKLDNAEFVTTLRLLQDYLGFPASAIDGCLQALGLAGARVIRGPGGCRRDDRDYQGGRRRQLPHCREKHQGLYI